MFVKRAFLLAVLLVGAFAQDARELAVSKPNEGGEIKVVKNKDDVLALANRWATSLLAGWNNATDVVNPAAVLAEYAPDGAVTVHSSKGGFATGSQLLATVEATPLNTNALRMAYFNKFLANKPVRI